MTFEETARAHILQTFLVTEQEAAQHALDLCALLGEKLGDLATLAPSTVRRNVEVALGHKLHWRNAVRRDAFMAELKAEMDEARRRGLLR